MGSERIYAFQIKFICCLTPVCKIMFVPKVGIFGVRFACRRQENYTKMCLYCLLSYPFRVLI